MKIVTWNCNGAFRRKFEMIKALDADIMVIQECEDPEQCSDNSYKSWATNYIWVGDTKHKGIGIFCKEHVRLYRNEWEDNGTKYIISARINNDFDLIAVWTQSNKANTFGYIGQFWKYLQVNKNRMNECIILGDFNSNRIWKKKHRICNHSNVVQELQDLKAVSLYHEYYNKHQGEETHPTFYMYRNLAKPYHIDYIFASKLKFPNAYNFEIGAPSYWLSISDHMPVIAVLNIC